MADSWTWNLHGDFLLTQKFRPYLQNQYWPEIDSTPELDLALSKFMDTFQNY